MAGMEPHQGRSDAELLALALAGDESAFVLLYERLKAGIFRYAFYMTNSVTTAEEVTQDVFVSLISEGKAYRDSRGDVGAFAFGIARNFVRRARRRERTYQPLLDDEAIERLAASLVSGAEAVHAKVIRDEVTEQVRAAIATLPEHYAQPVILCDLCEFSYAEAASRLGCAVGTIRSRLSRAHLLLARKLEPLKKSQPEIAAAGTAGTEGCLI
jgi:RNA polymerase sigma-70 factor (ECF subfamily)